MAEEYTYDPLTIFVYAILVAKSKVVASSASFREKGSEKKDTFGDDRVDNEYSHHICINFH